MAGPTVTVTLAVMDNVTGKMNEIKALARGLNQSIAPNLGLGKATGEVNDLKSGLQGLGSIAKTAGSVVAGAFALMAGAVATHAFKMNMEIADLQSRMEAFGGLTKEAAENMRKIGATELAGFKGGQKGAMKASKAAAYVGVNEESLPDVARAGMIYADALDIDPGEGTEKLLQLLQMNGRLKDEKGNKIDISKASREQLRHAVNEELGHQIALNRVMPGKESDNFEFAKIAGPELRSMHVSEPEQDAMQYFLAQGGITGSHAGTYVRGVYSRANKVTDKSVAVDRQFGLDPFAAMKIDKKAITGDSVTAGLEARWGTFDPETRAKIKKTVDEFHTTGQDLGKLNTSLTDVVKGSGKKGAQNDAVVGKGVTRTLTNYSEGVDLPTLLESTKAHFAKQGKEIPASWYREHFGVEIGTAVQAIVQNMTKEGWDKLHNLNSDKSYSQQAQEAADARLNSLPGQFQRFQNLVDGIQTTLMHMAEPSMIAGLKSINDALQNFSSNIGTYADGIKQIGEALKPVGELIYSKFIQPGLDLIDLIAKLGSAIANMLETIRPYAEALGLMKKKDKLPGEAGGPEGPRAPLPGEIGGPEGPAAPKSIWPTLTDTAGFVGNTVKTVSDAKKKVYDTVGSWVTEAVEMATTGNPDSPNAKRGTTGQMRRNMNEDGGFTQQPPVPYVPTELNGTVTGQGQMTINVETTPSQWLISKVGSMENAIISLQGRVGNDKVGVNMPGSNGALPSTGNGR